MPTNNALHYLDKDFGFGGNALDESAETKVKKINVRFWFIMAKRKGKKVKTIFCQWVCWSHHWLAVHHLPGIHLLLFNFLQLFLKKIDLHTVLTPKTTQTNHNVCILQFFYLTTQWLVAVFFELLNFQTKTEKLTQGTIIS